MTPANLEALLVVLKRNGVRSYHDPAEGGCMLEFFEPVSATPRSDIEKVLKESAEADMCQCGHGLHAHNNGHCVLGCEPEKCLPKEAT